MRLVLIPLLMFFGSFAGISPSLAKDFPLCRSHRASGGDILYLSKEGRTICWKVVEDDIPTTDLFTYSNAYRFVYVFGEPTLSQDFDPIFNVQIKQIAKEGEVLSNYINLYRKEIETLCGKSFFRKLNKRINIEFKPNQMDGAVYNNYHSGKSRDPGRTLSRFHIWFQNSRKECVRTDSSDLRPSFTIEDILFPPRQPLIARLFLGTGTALASGPGASQYRQISVEIGQGSFRGDNILATGSFSVRPGAEYDIVANDLSTYIDRRHRRAAKHFSITNPEE